MAGGDELDWNDLQYFLRAAQATTLAGAARAMGVEHTTVGRRLSALERSLGAPLFMRGPEGLTLTALGAQLLPLVERVESAVAAVSSFVAQQGHRVRLAVPSGFTQLFAPSLARLRAQQPKISLELVSGARPVDLKKGEADLAIRSGTVSDRDLVARKLCLSGFSLYASKAYLARCKQPIDPDDLTGHDLVGYDERFAATLPAKWMAAHAAGANIALRSREMTDVLAAASSGVGLAVLPCMLGDAEPTLERVTAEVVAHSPLSLVYRREARLAAPVRAVIRFVIDVMEENADRITGVLPATH